MKNLSKKIIIGNWKMNLDYKSSLSLSKKITKLIKNKKYKNNILLLPDFLSLPSVIKNINNKNIFYGSQDVSPFSLGAYTGEISLESLKQIRCSYILIGHSERRQYFFDNLLISEKIKNVLENSSLIPILCVGETWKDRQAGKTIEVISEQLKDAFLKVKSLKNKKIIIAYEPVWAIGSGRVVSTSNAILAHKKIKELIIKMFKNNLPKELGIVYGGSVNLDNYKNFQNSEDISGLLIGGTSLKANDFVKIIINF